MRHRKNGLKGSEKVNIFKRDCFGHPLRGVTLAMTNCRAAVVACVVIAILVVALGQVSEAREIRAKILQEKLGRLYFSAGKDEDVWPGCTWRVYRDSTDTNKFVCEGRIAESYEGVSISDSMVNPSAQLTSSSVARIEAADRVKPYRITLVTTIDCLSGTYTNFLDSGSLTEDRPTFPPEERGSDFASQYQHGATVDTTYNVVSFYPTGFSSGSKRIQEMPWLDGEVVYSPSENTLNLQVYSTPAPHFVALIPNVSRPINRNALLTTALRYRIDTSQINNAFEFESIPQLSFLPGIHSYSAYTADISKAKKLLKENRTAGATVSIDTYSPTLKSTSRYIQGTLTQAGYATTVVGWNEPADLRLAILPIYSDSPWVALSEVLTSIAKDTIAKDKANQPVRLADQLLKDALATSDSTRRMQLLERVNRMLMEDIGAFPLFRPIIYVCAKEEVRGIKFDKDGRLDLRSIYRLKLPSDSTEVQR